MKKLICAALAACTLVSPVMAAGDAEMVKAVELALQQEEAAKMGKNALVCSFVEDLMLHNNNQSFLFYRSIVQTEEFSREYMACTELSDGSFVTGLAVLNRGKVVHADILKILGISDNFEIKNARISSGILRFDTVEFITGETHSNKIDINSFRLLERKMIKAGEY